MPEIQETNKGTGIKGKSTTRQANTGKLTLLTYMQGNYVSGGSWSKLREVTTDNQYTEAGKEVK